MNHLNHSNREWNSGFLGFARNDGRWSAQSNERRDHSVARRVCVEVSLTSIGRVYSQCTASRLDIGARYFVEISALCISHRAFYMLRHAECVIAAWRDH